MAHVFTKREDSGDSREDPLYEHHVAINPVQHLPPLYSPVCDENEDTQWSCNKIPCLSQSKVYLKLEIKETRDADSTSGSGWVDCPQKSCRDIIG